MSWPVNVVFGTLRLSDNSKVSTPLKRIMPDCKECGANVALDENFCGSCGAGVKSDSPVVESAPADADLSNSLGIGSSTWGPPKEEAPEPTGTGEIDKPEAGATSRA